MSDEQIKDIVIDNLDRMEDAFRSDYNEGLVPIDDNILVACILQEKGT